MKLFSTFATVLAFSATSYAQTQYTSTAASAVEAARATALTLSPTSSVKGKTFHRFVSIWLENQDYDIAAADRMSLPHYPPRRLFLADAKSFIEMDRKPRHHAQQLQSHNPPQPTQLRRGRRRLPTLGLGRLVLPDRQLRENDR
jgi:hypothetical protein